MTSSRIACRWLRGLLRMSPWLLAILALSSQLSAQVLLPNGNPLDPSLGALSASEQSRTMDQQTTVPQTVMAPGERAPYQPTSIADDPGSGRTYSPDELVRAAASLDAARRMKWPTEPGEFELFVEKLVGHHVPRFGADLALPSSREFAAPANATVPPDYLLNVGDLVAISLAGSLEGSVERRIDSSGNVVLPQVGAIHLAGVRFADLRDRIADAIGTEYRGFGVAVELKELAGLRIYVTGFANNPGMFTVSSLSTMASAVFQAGGPSSGGSLRRILLYRDGRQVAELDLYDLLRGGSRVGDAVLRNEDVLFIPPAGVQLAVIGSVHHEAIYELRPGETLSEALDAAGGPNALADRDRIMLYRNGPGARPGPRQLSSDEARRTLAESADIVQVLSAGSLVQPMDRQSVVVRIEGEVQVPGNYYVAPGTPLSEAIGLAGGLTPRAFPYGTRLERQSVRQQQRIGFEEAIDQLELTIASAPLTADPSQTAERSAAELASARAVLAELRDAEPDGRVVLDVHPADRAVPGSIVLENNDRVYVPPRASTVGVFGAVYRPSSFLVSAEPARIKDYIEQAGGAQRAADMGDVFVVRANGEVLTRKAGAMGARALPGDVIFVPVRTSNSNFWTKLREISTVVFQLGVTAAAIRSFGN